MAIKISGSTIIDDSRNIVNAGVTTVGVLTGTDARFSGTVEGNEYLGSGTKLTGIVTSIVAGANISVDQSTGQVTVTGLANTSNVIADTINTGSLNVTGLSTFAGLVDINAGGQANTFKVEDLTDNRVVIAGTGGELEDSANLTFDGTTLAVTGNETISGTLDVDGQTDLDVLNVAELATFTDNIVANGNIVGDNSTNISGISSVTSTTYFGDGSNLTNIISGVGVQTSGGYIGAGVTTLDFRGSGVSTVTNPSSGFSTVFVDFDGTILGSIWSKNETNFTASEGQVTFTKTYNPGNVDVYLNGVRQISGDNYTAANGTSVGLTTAANVGDKVDIIAYNTAGAQALSLSRTVGLVTATANQTAFTVPSYDLGNSSLDVYLNGIKLEPTQYTETNGTTITLASGATVGDILQAFSYDVSGGNYWQLNGNVLHRSPLYNSPVGIGTNKQTDQKEDLTVGQLGVGSTSLVVHGQAVFTGNVSVAGTLTAENKTNIDSLGIVTARTGIDVDAGGINIDAGGINVTAGIATFGGSASVAGDFGIGKSPVDTNSFSRALDVNGPSGAAIYIRNNAPTETNKYGFIAYFNSDLYLYNKDAGPIRFFANAAEKMRLTSGGKLGINETAPAAELVVKQSGNTFTTASQTVALFQRSSTTGHSAKIAIVAGNAAASDINFGDVDDEDAGLIQYAHTDNSFKFHTNANASASMVIDSSGNVGVNNLSPGSYNSDGRNLVVGSGSGGQGLSIVSGTGSYGTIYFADGTSGDALYRGSVLYNHASDFMRFDTAGGEKVRIDSSGKIGVGVNSPLNTVHIHSSTSGVGPIVQLTNDTGDCRLFFGQNSSAGDANAQGQVRYNVANNYLAFYTAAAEKVRIDSSGKLGIGLEPSGSSKLQVNGSMRFAGSGTASDSTNPVIYRASGFDHLKFATSGTERLTIDSSGRVLINTAGVAFNGVSAIFQVEGTTDTLTRMSIRRTSNDANPGVFVFGKTRSSSHAILSNDDNIGQIEWYGADGGDTNQRAALIKVEVDGTPGTNDMPGRLIFATTPDGNTTPTERLRLQSTGSARFLASGTHLSIDASTTYSASSSQQAFQVVRDRTAPVTGGTAVFRVYTNGDAKNTNGTFTTLSDERLKENIVDSDSQWEDIKQIRIRKWNYVEITGNQTHTQIGPIAQELEVTSPGLVRDYPVTEDEVVVDKDGNELTSTKGVLQSVLYMKSVKALQEAMERIETLEQRLSDAGL